MKYVNFNPWVGEKYFTEGFCKIKLLILGESHYCSGNLSDSGKCAPICQKEKMESSCFDFTNDVMKEYLKCHDGLDWHNTFLSFERNLFNKNLSQIESRDFWDRVIFFNYIQFALPSAGVKPNDEFWVPSEKAFREILDYYMPDKIIAWGTRLCNGLPDWGRHHSIIQVDNYQTDIWKYTIKDKVIPVLKVHHPCCPKGKAREKWFKLYNKFLES